jgi:RecA-family ATPase
MAQARCMSERSESGLVDRLIEWAQNELEADDEREAIQQERPQRAPIDEADEYYAGRTAQRVARNGSAADSRGEEPPPPSTLAPLFDAAQAAIGMQTFTEYQGSPEFIVDGLLPCDIGARLGAGGAAKSTLDLWEAVHIVMGWRLYGRDVLRPGKVLIVSAEDNVRRIRYRLRMLCDQLPNLTPAAKEHIACSLLVEDLTGKGVRLVGLDRDGNLMQTGAANALIDAYSGVDLSLVSFDPFVYFGPGERFVNDGEAAMAQVAHRICNGLSAAVRYTHHTGKSNAREGRTDQYSNRGGSALPDGMRFVHVLSRAEKRTEGTPATITDEDLVQRRVLTLHAPKLTDAPPILSPIWIRRVGWHFEHITAKADDAQNLQREGHRRLFEFVAEQAKSGVRHSKRSLGDNYKTIGLSRDGLRSAVHASLELGYLVEMDLPKAEQQGGLKTYLAAGNRP